MEAIKPLQIDEATHANLKKLAKDHGRSMKQMVAEMVNYFKQSGQDPQEVNAGNSANAIKSLERRFTTMMKKQERDALAPMLDELAVASRTLKEAAEGTLSKEVFVEKMGIVADILKGIKATENNVVNGVNDLSSRVLSYSKKTDDELAKIKTVIEEKLGKKGLF